MKKAEIIIIGEEHAYTKASATGADVIAHTISVAGFAEKSRYYVDLDPDDVLSALDESYKRYDMTVLTGNSLDFPVTAAKACAKVLDLKTVTNTTIYACMRSYAKKHGSSLTDGAYDLCIVPEGATVLECESVPITGYYLERDGKYLFVLPGTPEYIGIICETVLQPIIAGLDVDLPARTRVNLINAKLASLHIETARIERDFPGVCARAYHLTAESALELSAPGLPQEEGRALIDRALASIRSGVLHDNVYGTDTTLPEAVVDCLRRTGKTLAAAESCTGGLLAKMLTDVPGSSDVFPGGVVSYSNSIKRAFLGVTQEVLEEYGAVSHRCAIQMSEGAVKYLAADWGIGITGIAGPGGGTPEKPVGLVYVSIANSHRSRVLKYQIEGDRETVRTTVAKYALRELLVRMLRHERRNNDDD